MGCVKNLLSLGAYVYIADINVMISLPIKNVYFCIDVMGFQVACMDCDKHLQH